MTSHSTMAKIVENRMLLLFFLSLCCCSAVECDLYMAESTIPNAGLGIFSAIELNPGDPVGEGDVCIPLFDLNSHHPDPFNPFGDYVWAGEVMGMKLEIESDDIEALCPVGSDCYLFPIIFQSFSLPVSRAWTVLSIAT
jgi:hypothetical protein